MQKKEKHRRPAEIYNDVSLESSKNIYNCFTNYIAQQNKDSRTQWIA